MATTRILASDADLLSLYFGSPVTAIRERLCRALSGDETSLSRFLDHTNNVYPAPSDVSATGLPDRSVDIYYSYALLTHVRDHAAEVIASEVRRVLMPDRVYQDAIGPQDQYSLDPAVSVLNFRKYAEWLSALLVKNKISYTNRLLRRDFLDMLKRQGADTLKVTSIVKPDNVQRVKSMKIGKRFAGYSPEELATIPTGIMAGWPGKPVSSPPVRERHKSSSFPVRNR
jgi:hypothetical protein